jgi:hypothetical protein
MERLSEIVNGIYVYCTDFIINLANILDWSYYEVNALIFCLIYPLFIIVLIGIFFIQKWRLKKVKLNFSKK